MKNPMQYEKRKNDVQIPQPWELVPRRSMPLKILAALLRKEHKKARKAYKNPIRVIREDMKR